MSSTKSGLDGIAAAIDRFREEHVPDLRSGVFDVRASPFLPTSALIRDDLPTLERPAKAISGGPSGGRNFIAGTPRMNTHGRVKTPDRAAGAAAGSSVMRVVRPPAGYSAGFGFFLNRPARLSHSSILAPWRFMMTPCWMIESRLFHAQ